MGGVGRKRESSITSTHSEPLSIYSLGRGEGRGSVMLPYYPLRIGRSSKWCGERSIQSIVHLHTAVNIVWGEERAVLDSQIRNQRLD